MKKLFSFFAFFFIFTVTVNAQQIDTLFPLDFTEKQLIWIVTELEEILESDFEQAPVFTRRILELKGIQLDSCSFYSIIRKGKQVGLLLSLPKHTDSSYLTIQIEKNHFYLKTKSLDSLDNGKSWRYHSGKKYGDYYMESVCEYANSEMNGLLTGYRKNGNLMLKIELVDGIPNGMSRFYDKNGVLKNEYPMKDGKFVKEKES